LVRDLEYPMVLSMGWAARERASMVGSSRPSIRVRRVPAQALRGATTLEQQALPLAIMACFAALATIQLILTW
jgi:hypothetical protein